MLEIKGSYKMYSKYHTLSDLGVNVSSGTLYGFVRPNGAEKTITIKIMASLFTADEGKATIDEVNTLRGLRDLETRIGYVSDFSGAYDNLTVSEYMELFASRHRLDRLTVRRWYAALPEQVGLEDKLDFYVNGLPRGMRQKLYLAGALIHDPSIPILDEPTSGLDPRTRFEFEGMLKELQESGKTTATSSYVLSELSELYTDIGIIDQGRMMLERNTGDIFSRTNTSNPLVIAIFSSLEKTLSALESHPCVRTISLWGQDIYVRFDGDAQDEVLLFRQLVDSDVLINGFIKEGGNLESVLMQLTEHEEEKMVVSHDTGSGFQP